MQLRKNLASVAAALMVCAVLATGTAGSSVAESVSFNPPKTFAPTMIDNNIAAPSGEVSLMYLDEDMRLAIRYSDRFAADHRFEVITDRDVEAAVGRKYRGGVSVVTQNEYGKVHIIVRYGKTLHGPHYRGL